MEISGQKAASPVVQSEPKQVELKKAEAPQPDLAKPELDETRPIEISNEEKLEELSSLAEAIEEAPAFDLKKPEETKKRDLLSPVEDFFKDGPEWFQLFRNHFVMVLNVVGVAMNTMSVVASGSNILPKPVAEYLDNAAEWYSRYVVSIGFGWNGIESLVGRRPIEALTRFVPAAGFLALPFYNFNLATGVSSGLNYVLGEIVKRNGDKQPGVGSMMENTKGILKHAKELAGDFFNKNSSESFLDKVTMAGLLGGSFGALLFARNDRDTGLARFFGNLRNIGGLAGDYELVFNRDTTWRGNHKRFVGLSCSLASVLNIIARWVNPQLGRTLNHLAIAADDFGLTYWAQMSKLDNDEAQGKAKDAKANSAINQAVEAKPSSIDEAIRQLSLVVNKEAPELDLNLAQAA